MTNCKTYNLTPLDFRTKHTLLGQRENKIGTPFKTYDNEKRAVGNPLQASFLQKHGYFDNNVETGKNAGLQRYRYQQAERDNVQ